MTRNTFEDRVAATLPKEYAYEPIKLKYVVEKNYIPDFVDVANKKIVEAKGFWRAEDRAKILAVKKQHPDWTIKIVFQNAKKTISKTSKTTYSDYCEKHGIEWEEAAKPVKKVKK